MINYKVTEEIQKPSTAGRYMGPGIHDNVEMTRVEYAKTEKSEYIAFYFVNDKNEQLSHTEWKMRMSKKVEDMDEGLLRWYSNKLNEQIARINKIVTTFIPQDKYLGIEASDFESFCKKTIDVLGNEYIGKKVRIKVVYDRRNFTSLPAYINYNWIEPMSVAKENSTIEILGKDKMVKSVPQKIEGADFVHNEIEASATNDTLEKGDESDLPF
jgi:hypothetical protein